MTEEDKIALELFAEAHGGLKRNGEMCFDAESLDRLLRARAGHEREATLRRQQEPLGEPFASILAELLDELYET